MILFYFALFGGSKSPVFADRVKKVASAAALDPVKDDKEKSFFERVLMPMSERIGKMVGGLTPGNITANSSQLLDEAGIRAYITGSQLAGFCWMMGIGLPLFMLVLYGKSPVEPGLKVMAIMISAIIGFRMPLIIVQNRAKSRKNLVLRSLPFALDLLSISVEAGMGFDGAIQTVSERTKGPLAQEMSRTLAEVRLGRPRNQALLDLGIRTGVDDLRRFTAAVAFVSELGGSLSDVLRVQSEAMRIRQRQMAEEKAMKAPVKMMFPLICCILPALIIVIAAPAAISIYENFVKR